MVLRSCPVLLAGVFITLVLTGCKGPELQRQTVVDVRGETEAYDALVQVLVQRFGNLDAARTDRQQLMVATDWQRADDPQRLVRRRAVGWVRWLPEEDRALVEVAVERQISTQETAFGEVDRQHPVWVGGSSVADSTMERELLLAVRKRLEGPIE